MSLSPMIRVVRLAIGIAVRRPVAEVMPTRTILAPDPRHRHRTCAMPPARKPGLAGSLGAAGRGSGVSCRKGRPAYCSACFGASRWRGQAWAAPGMPSRRLGRPAHTRCRQGPGHGRMDRGSAAACLPARTAQAVAIGRRTPLHGAMRCPPGLGSRSGNANGTRAVDDPAAHCGAGHVRSPCARADCRQSRPPATFSGPSVDEDKCPRKGRGPRPSLHHMGSCGNRDHEGKPLLRPGMSQRTDNA
ncbi:hypothetical protein SAMN04244567_04012 [Paracoccus pantotrophus]|nr:hypothetical protein SAMN04244567_04012 [Paracoccus pantotrophus]